METLRVLRWLCPLSFCSHCPRCYRDPELQVVWRIWANSPGTGASLSLRWLAGWLCLSWKMSAMGHRPCPRWIGLSFTQLSPGLQKTVPHTHTHAPNSDLLHAPPVTPRAHPWGGPPPRSLLPRAAAHPPRVAQPHFPLGTPVPGWLRLSGHLPGSSLGVLPLTLLTSGPTSGQWLATPGEAGPPCLAPKTTASARDLPMGYPGAECTHGLHLLLTHSTVRNPQ